MQIKTFNTAPKFNKLQNLAIAVQTGGTVEISRALLQLQTDDAFSTVGWQKAFNLLADAFADNKPRFSIFAKGGNSKLPFVAFSTLPGVTCPGFCVYAPVVQVFRACASVRPLFAHCGRG